MRINELAKLTEVSKRNIHFYIKQGLITPAADENSGYYDFSRKDQQRLCIIRDLRKMKFSLSTIQSILEHPDTLGLYVNGQITDLKRQCRQIQLSLDSLNHIMFRLPFHTTLDAMQELVKKATVDMEPIEEFQEMDEFTEYDLQTVSLFVWAPFLESNHLTEYQQFLWEKLKKMVVEYALEDYKKIKEFLFSYEQNFSNEMYVTDVPHYKKISQFTDKEAVNLGYEIIEYLKKFLCNNAGIEFWKTNYESLYIPMCHIHETPMAEVMNELSPMYCSYKKMYPFQ